MENQWFPFIIKPEDISHLNFPLEFLFVFVLREVTQKYNVKLCDITFVSKSFSANSRFLENGEQYSTTLKSVWFASDLKGSNFCDMATLSDEVIFGKMSERYYIAQRKAFERIDTIETISTRESIVKVLQELFIVLKINNKDVRFSVSVPVGLCLYKAKSGGRIF